MSTVLSSACLASTVPRQSMASSRKVTPHLGYLMIVDAKSLGLALLLIGWGAKNEIKGAHYPVALCRDSHAGADVIDRIADGRTDLVFGYINEGRPATSKDAEGVSLIEWCAYY